MSEQTDAAEVEASIRFHVDGECQWTASPHARTLELFGVELAPGPHDITIVLPDAAAREAAAEARGAVRALREAADDWESDDTDPTPRMGSRADGWLRLRADRIAAAAAGGACCAHPKCPGGSLCCCQEADR